MTLERIVSGGQTGVDRGALDAALAAAVSCGGWCPAGRRAEDGRIPHRYPLRETKSAAYGERTGANVRDSDGTLVLAYGAPSGGTALTVQCCRELDRPFLLVDALSVSPGEAGQCAARFVGQYSVVVLNVAGPRESETPGAQRYAFETLQALLGAC